MKAKKPVMCMHRGCWRPAVRICSWEQPKHREFKGQTHDCCAVHSRGLKEQAIDKAVDDSKSTDL